MQDGNHLFARFMAALILLALIGLALLIVGALTDPGLPRLVPGIGMIARYCVHG